METQRDSTDSSEPTGLAADVQSGRYRPTPTLLREARINLTLEEFDQTFQDGMRVVAGTTTMMAEGRMLRAFYALLLHLRALVEAREIEIIALKNDLMSALTTLNEAEQAIRDVTDLANKVQRGFGKLDEHTDVSRTSEPGA